MSGRQLAEWEIYAKVDPFGAEADFYQASMIASTIVNVNLKKGSKLCTVKDFMPKFDEQKEDKWKHIKNVFSALSTKKVKRKEKDNG